MNNIVTIYNDVEGKKEKKNNWSNIKIALVELFLASCNNINVLIKDKHNNTEIEQMYEDFGYIVDKNELTIWDGNERGKVTTDLGKYNVKEDEGYIEFWNSGKSIYIEDLI